MTISGLLFGMTMPAILSNDWQDPASFSRLFTLGLGALTLACASILSRFKAPATQDAQALQLQEPQADPASAALPKPKAQAKATPDGGGGGSILANKFFRLLLLNVFLCQVGNALLASTQPLYARHVIGLAPVGPLLNGLVPLLDAKWQFSLCYLLFYSMGALSSRFWSSINAAWGPLRTLRTALSAYALGCFMIPVLPGGGLAAVLAHAAPGVAPPLQTALGKLALFALVYMWNGFCLGGMVALPVPSPLPPPAAVSSPASPPPPLHRKLRRYAPRRAMKSG